MDKKKEMLLLTLIRIGYITGKYSDFNINHKYFNDEEFIDCQLTLYLFLLTEEGEKQDKLNKEFQEKYNRLSKEKKEYIREDLKKLFEVKEKNNEEKEKRL